MRLKIASSSNGRTADSDSVNLGSSPGEAANLERSCIFRYNSLFFRLIVKSRGRGKKL